MKTVAMPNCINIECASCSEVTELSNRHGVLLWSASSFIIDHSMCEPKDGNEVGAFELLKRTVDDANKNGVTEITINKGL